MIPRNQKPPSVPDQQSSGSSRKVRGRSYERRETNRAACRAEVLARSKSSSSSSFPRPRSRCR
eukprot:scaffold434_cov186-Pinguiococcus_pyrenoidosus.AAC.98